METARTKSAAKLGPVPPAECGVWLDAAELREKKQQQQRLRRPISKLLNPLARSGGYSMAVALKFTQTKMHMPATKQSTISSFFQPRSKVNKDYSSTLLSEAHTGIKRKRAATAESPLKVKITDHDSPAQQEFETDLQREAGEVCKMQKQQQDFFHLIWGFQSEECEPAAKGRHHEDVTMENVTETQKESNRAVLHRCGSADEIQNIPESLLHWDYDQQDSDDSQLHRNIFRQNKVGSSASSFAGDYNSHEDRRACTLMDKNVFVQKPVLTARSVMENQHTVKRSAYPHKELALPKLEHYTHCSPVKKNKENSGPTSTIHNSEVSYLKRILSLSPDKHVSKFEKPNVFLKGKHESPKKSAKEYLENEQDSFDTLFTQDSEGFRVIANRNRQTRCPLQDRTNSPEAREKCNLPVMPMESEEDSDLEPKLLFTQDSQGNMVIKH